ncbi:haloacid dehalogenase-like hydrolase [Fusobacterium gastrosuis]|uniref:haloacid dehalogenase-like hydrolase n=1 Tax=Fusobacterium gastrosuis TaxID=1755100 RepID=UPI003F53CECB
MSLSVYAANLDEGRWVPQNREILSKLIDENKNKDNYVVFDWDYTSIYQDTQENLFRYQIDNLKFKMTPEEFSKAIRIDIPLDDFDKDYSNINGEAINITKIGNDLDKTYTFIYENYLKDQKMTLDEIKATEEFKDFRGKLAFLYEAIGGSFSHDVSYPWVLYLFHGMTRQEVKALAKEANDFGIGNKLESYTIESSDILIGEAGKVSYKYKSGLRTQPEIANLFHELRDNGIKVYVVSASLQDIVQVFANDRSYGYNLDEENVYGMRLEMNGDKYTYNYKKGYPQTQTKGKVEIINKYIKPRHNGKEPILVAGDSSGDYNMLTEFKEIKVLLLMKREGKLDDLVNDSRAIIQKRNPQTGLLSPSN